MENLEFCYRDTKELFKKLILLLYYKSFDIYDLVHKYSCSISESFYLVQLKRFWKTRLIHKTLLIFIGDAPILYEIFFNINFA